MARYATTLFQDDGIEVISSIAETSTIYEVGPIESSRFHDVIVGHREIVPANVKIGMVRNGPQEPVGEWGWLLGSNQGTRRPTEEEIEADKAFQAALAARKAPAAPAKSKVPLPK